MAYYTRSKFNFVQNILTVQRPGRIPFTIVFAQFFHKFDQPKLTSNWLYRCPRPHPNLHDQCLEFLLGITVVPREIEHNNTMVMSFFFGAEWVGGGGETRCIVVYVKMVNCWVFVFLPFYHSRKIFKDHVVIGVASWLDQSGSNFFMMIQINIIHYLQLYG